MKIISKGLVMGLAIGILEELADELEISVLGERVWAIIKERNNVGINNIREVYEVLYILPAEFPTMVKREITDKGSLFYSYIVK